MIIRVWDLPIRIFHWLIVCLIAAAWGTVKLDLMQWHKLIGYAILTLLIARLGWGFIGSSTARFMHFISGPRKVLAYARHFFSAAPGDTIGHNPMGALSVIALLAALWTQVLTGLVLSDSDFVNSGPLSGLVSYDVSFAADKIHKLSFTILEILVALHIAVIAFYAFRKRDNLVLPMISGLKEMSADPGRSLPVFVPAWRALLLLSIAAGFVYWLVNYAAPKIPGF